MNDHCLYIGLTGARAELAELRLEFLLGSFLGSLALALLLSPLVLHLYQRRVTRLMTLDSGPRTPTADGPEDESGHPSAGEAPGTAQPSAATLLAAAKAGAAGYRRVNYTAIGVFAGLVTLLIGAYLITAEGLTFASLQGWLRGAVYPLVVAVGGTVPLVLMIVQARRTKLVLSLLFATLLTGAAWFDIVLDPAIERPERLSELAWALASILIMYAAALGRRIRNVVPLLTPLIYGLIIMLVAWGILSTIFEDCNALVANLVYLGLTVASIWLFSKLVLAVVRRLTTAYEGRKFSNIQFQLGVWTITLAIIFTLEVGYKEDIRLDPWSMGILAAAAAAVVVYVRLAKTLEAWPAPRTLLLLRVFSRSMKHQSLLDVATFYWAFIGPIYLVGGPDLAKFYLDPHELLLFLRRRLRELFLLDLASLRRRLGGLESLPDADGRFRTEEFFCSDLTWRHAASALIDRSDFILLDLRGFHAERRGTAFEVTLLARKNALERSVVLTDETTDMAAVQAALAAVPGARIGPEQMLHADQVASGLDVVSALADRAGVAA